MLPFCRAPEHGDPSKKAPLRRTWEALDERRMVIYFARFRPNSQWNHLCATIVGHPVSAGATHLPQTEPDPLLSPHDVVRIQIESLRNNDTPMKTVELR